MPINARGRLWFHRLRGGGHVRRSSRQRPSPSPQKQGLRDRGASAAKWLVFAGDVTIPASSMFSLSYGSHVTARDPLWVEWSLKL